MNGIEGPKTGNTECMKNFADRKRILSVSSKCYFLYNLDRLAGNIGRIAVLNSAMAALRCFG